MIEAEIAKNLNRDPGLDRCPVCWSKPAYRGDDVYCPNKECCLYGVDVPNDMFFGKVER